MYKKVIFATILIAFIGVQLATSLQCFTCNSPSGCRNPSKQTCSNSTANSTSNSLRIHHDSVANIAGSTSFQCVNTTWHYNNSAQAMVLGCVHPQVQVCSLPLKPEYRNQNWTRICYTCSGDLCNGNPAATFSSSFYTILASVIGLILAKTFA